jgi:hypothetical protein
MKTLAPYADLEPHADRCDAAMQALVARVQELESLVASQAEQMRKMGITIAKLGDAIGDFNVHVEGDWYLNE